MMKITFNLIVFAALLLGCTRIHDMDTYLRELHEDGKLNGNVLVIQNDSILYEHSFGYADGDKNHLLTPAHRFALGSIQKEFPGVAIMQLKEKDLLSLEDSLSHFLPHLPAWANKIKVRNLLQYSSGLPHVDWDAHFKKGIANQRMIVEDLSKLKELEFEPGTDYLYSNFNPMLLERIVESLTGMKFKEYVEKQMIIPYDLESLVVKEEYPYQDASLMAIPFNKDFKVDDYKAEVTTVCSSARGMYNYFNLLDNFKIISRESMKQLSEEVMPGENVQSPLGQCDWNGDDIELHFHHGNSQNYESLVRHYKEDGFLIILMTNQDNENLYDIADNIYDYYKEKQRNKAAVNHKK